MKKRVRLTDRARKAACEGAQPDHSTPYPGTVNQEDRKFPENDKYDTFKHTVGHEAPDMRHEWKDDKRDDMNVGIPEAWGKKSASGAEVRKYAQKAVTAAVYFLGDRAAENVIEAQAMDFMAMGPDAIDRTLQRFASTDELYDDTTKVASEAAPAPGEAVEGALEITPAPAPAADTADHTHVASDDEEEADKEACVMAEEPVVEDEVALEAPVESMDIDLAPDSGFEAEEDLDDSALQSIFSKEASTQPKVAEKKTSAKQGVKSLGGQPRIASAANEPENLSSLWKTAPDISGVF